MKDHKLTLNQLDLIELNQDEMKKIEGGLPWFLIGLITGIAYYLAAK